MTRLLFAAALSGLLVSCGAPQDPATEDLTAAEHEHEAAREDRQAASHEQRAEFRQLQAFGEDVYNPAPDPAQLAEAEEHRRHAEAHRQQAAELLSFEEQECALFPESTRPFCPFLLGLETVEDIDGGARMTFGPDANVEAIEHHVRCHLAFVAAHGADDLADCVLWVPGAVLEVDGNVFRFVTDRPEQVAELRRRARTALTHAVTH